MSQDDTRMRQENLRIEEYSEPEVAVKWMI
jgi:hypothetical protein